MPYEDQLPLKQELVNRAFRERGLGSLNIQPIIRCDQPLFYRNKMEFSFGLSSQGHVQLGLHARDRYSSVFDVVGCCLQSEISNRIVVAARKLAGHAGLTTYDLHAHTGLLRFLVIREGKNSGEILVNLVVSDYPREDVQHFAELLCRDVPERSCPKVAVE